MHKKTKRHCTVTSHKIQTRMTHLCDIEAEQKADWDHLQVFFITKDHRHVIVSYPAKSLTVDTKEFILDFIVFILNQYNSEILRLN